MAKRAKPFKYRGKWRAQVTLKNGTRPWKDFETHDEAGGWINGQYANADTEHLPELGGPKQASLAQAMAHYAGLNTITKGGYAAEMDRINHYLAGAGLNLLKIVVKDGKRELIDKPTNKLPTAFEAHKNERINQRMETYKQIATLAKRSCSALCTADFRRLMVNMEKEGLSPSTIQKEIALLKHLFNVAAAEWSWKGFENPCKGLKLGSSNQRFVFMTPTQKVALREALAQCDSPYFWSLVEICMQTTLRKGSLLAMTRANVDLDGRIAMLPSKTGPVAVPLSKKAVELLKGMPVNSSGAYFPMSGNAVDMAWDGVRIKIGMPELQFKDLRHIGATEYARAGANSHQLQKVLGHKSSRMAEVYVNLVNADTLEFLDRIAPLQAVYQVPEPAVGSGAEMLKSKRSKRLADAVVDSIKKAHGANGAPEKTPLSATEHFLTTAQNSTPAQIADTAHVPHEDVGDVEAKGLAPNASSQTNGQPTAAPNSAHTETVGFEEPPRCTGTHGPSATQTPSSNNVVRVDFKRKSK